MKFEIEIIAEQINCKELIAKINEAIEEETTELTSVGISYSENNETE